MANVVEIGSLIDRDPSIRGGRPKIAGTGVTIKRIVGQYKMGLVLTASDAGMINKQDEDHLRWATREGRVLCSFNIADCTRDRT